MKAASTAARPAATRQNLAPTQKKDDKIIAYNDMNGNKVDLSVGTIKQYICPGTSITDAEAYMFLTLCQFNGLNPFLRDAYCIKYGNNPATMIVAKSALLKRAQKNPKYKGIKSGVVVINRSGEIEYRKGGLLLDDESLVGAWADVSVDGYIDPISAVVNFREYCQYKDGKPSGNWQSKPATMLIKVAEAHALREAFPQDLGGLYNAEEMGYEEVETNSAPIASPTKEYQDVAYTDMNTGEVIEPDDEPNFFDEG